MVSSNFFVISRETEALRSSPRAAASCSRVLTIRKVIIENHCTLFPGQGRNPFCLLFLWRNPSKQKRSDAGLEHTSAGHEGGGAGSDSTGIPLSRHTANQKEARVRDAGGTGVRDKGCHRASLNASHTASRLRCSLNLWCDRKRTLIHSGQEGSLWSWCLRQGQAGRFQHSRARMVISPRFNGGGTRISLDMQAEFLRTNVNE